MYIHLMVINKKKKKKKSLDLESGAASLGPRTTIYLLCGLDKFFQF